MASNLIEWIRESNLIEGIDRPVEDRRSEKAWKWFVKQELTIPNILDLHHKITWQQLGSDAGQFRTCQVWVGGHEGAAHQKIMNLMLIWLETWDAPILNKKITPEQWCRESHVYFEMIHPFIDGNGRVGRMILQHQRAKHGLPPLLIKSEERGEYYQWFQV